MSNSSMVTYSRISPNKNKMVNKVNKKITIHHMAAKWTAKQCVDSFANPNRQGSSNYCIGYDGSVGMAVEEKDRAWTSSSSWNDSQAVTIEVSNDIIGGDWHVSDAAYNTLIELCVDICKRNGMTELVWTGDKNGSLTCHYMFAATACPGPYLKSKMPELAKEVTRRLRENNIGRYSLVFNAEYYSNHHQDLKNAFGNDVNALFQHFLNYGMKEGRQANDAFNPTIYKNKYEDLRNAFGNNMQSYYEHYIDYGYKEGRNCY